MSDRDRSVSAVVLAAGLGVRMRSERPKPLHLLCGRPMLLYVLDALADLDVQRAVVVVGSAAERVTKRVQEDLSHIPGGLFPVEFVEQAAPRGTGDALMAALGVVGDDDDTDDELVVLNGDMPMLSPASLARLVSAHRQADAACTVLVARLADPTGRARVLRAKDGRVARVVPQVDLVNEPDLATIDEVSASVYCFRRGVLGPALRRLTPDNPDGEYRLPDLVDVLHRAGYTVGSAQIEHPAELAEVDDRLHLAQIEGEIRRRINGRWLAAGVTMVDPSTCYIDATVKLAPDVTLFPNTLLQGRTMIGAGAEIGPDTRLVDCVVGAGARIEKVVGHDAEVGSDAVVGPFVSLEPGSEVPAGVRVEAFTTVRMAE